ncbi:DUF6950 family protein [Sphingomonas soli]|uniref:DUF6950 family protein n=1 Tax=Sphingomonas soli TaxID=266127 RepID=UPI00082B33A1|nr:hypothetical protein [Sphingomonas soli]
MTLGSFLKAAMADFGPWNCSTLAADWCLELGHPDFAAEWRGVADDEAARATVERSGGLLPLWERGIAGRLPVVETPQAADIAVITAIGEEAGAIWTGKRWSLRSSGGRLHFIESGTHIRVLKAWRP